MSRKHERKVADVSEAVLNLFQSYAWPGNVREIAQHARTAYVGGSDGTLPEAERSPTASFYHDPRRRSSVLRNFATLPGHA